MTQPQELCAFCRQNPAGRFSAVNKKTKEKRYICDDCASTHPAFQAAAQSKKDCDDLS